MKVFITGISGFIGSHLARALLNEGHEVSGLMRLTGKEPPEIVRGAAIYRGSLLDASALRAILRDERPDVVCHLGAVTPVAYSFDHPHEVVETNFLGTVNLCEAVRQMVPDIKRFVFAGTAEEYGNQEQSPIPETAELRAACPYAAAKIGAEAYVRYCHRVWGLPAVCFRQTNTYGRLDNNTFLVETILTQMLRGAPTLSMGDPRPVRDLMHIDDLVAAYRIALTDSWLVGRAVNVSTGEGISVHDLVDRCRDLTGWDGKIHWRARPPRPGEVWSLVLDPSAMRELTGWRAQIALPEGLQRTCDYWQSRL